MQGISSLCSKLKRHRNEVFYKLSSVFRFAHLAVQPKRSKKQESHSPFISLGMIFWLRSRSTKSSSSWQRLAQGRQPSCPNICTRLVTLQMVRRLDAHNLVASLPCLSLPVSLKRWAQKSVMRLAIRSVSKTALATRPCSST